MSALKKLSIKALDPKQAHLNARLSEIILLEMLSAEVVHAGYAVCGLRQSAMEWWGEL